MGDLSQAMSLLPQMPGGGQDPAALADAARKWRLSQLANAPTPDGPAPAAGLLPPASGQLTPAPEGTDVGGRQGFDVSGPAGGRIFPNPMTPPPAPPTPPPLSPDMHRLPDPPQGPRIFPSDDPNDPRMLPGGSNGSPESRQAYQDYQKTGMDRAMKLLPIQQKQQEIDEKSRRDAELTGIGQEENRIKRDALHTKPEPAIADLHRYTAILQAKEMGNPVTPEDEAWAKAFSKQRQEVTVAGGEARAKSYGETRQNAVVDKQTGEDLILNSTALNALNEKFPGRYAAASQNPELQARKSSVKEFATGTESDQIQSYRTWLGHADDLSEAVEGARLTGQPWLNTPLNKLRNMTGDPMIAAYIAKIEPVRKEYATFLLNNRALQGDDRQQAEKVLNENDSPAQMQAVLRSNAHTASIRMAAAGLKYKGANRGQEFPGMYDPESSRILEKFGVKVPKTTPPSGGQQASGGGDGQTATGPNGHKITVRGGKWVDAQTGAPIQ